MPKHKHKKHKPKHKANHHHRNAGPVAAPAKRRRPMRRAPAPDFSNTIASVAGGGGGALLGGFLANQEIFSPETVGLAMTVGGAVGAYSLDGNARIVSNGVAAAGAGQLALALMQKRATPKPRERADDKPAKKTNHKPDDDEAPARQGYRARVISNFQNVAPEVATRLGYVDSDEYDDAVDGDE